MELKTPVLVTVIDHIKKMALTDEQKEKLATLMSNRDNILAEVDIIKGKRRSTIETLSSLHLLSDIEINEIWPGTIIIDSGSDDGGDSGGRPTDLTF